MNVKEFVEKGIHISGYGSIKEMLLDKRFFKFQEEEQGKIKEVYEITKGLGGNILKDFCGDGCSIEGCAILFESGKLMIIESDGEYIDWFMCEP